MTRRALVDPPDLAGRGRSGGAAGRRVGDPRLLLSRERRAPRRLRVSRGRLPSHDTARRRSRGGAGAPPPGVAGAHPPGQRPHQRPTHWREPRDPPVARRDLPTREPGPSPPRPRPTGLGLRGRRPGPPRGERAQRAALPHGELRHGHRPRGALRHRGGRQPASHGGGRNALPRRGQPTPADPPGRARRTPGRRDGYPGGRDRVGRQRRAQRPRDPPTLPGRDLPPPGAGAAAAEASRRHRHPRRLLPAAPRGAGRARRRSTARGRPGAPRSLRLAREHPGAEPRTAARRADRPWTPRADRGGAARGHDGARRLPPGGAHRRGGDGRGVAGGAPTPRPSGRGQAHQRGPQRRRGAVRPRPVPSRGGGHRQAELAAHRGALRLRVERGRLVLLRDGAAPGDLSAEHGRILRAAPPRARGVAAVPSLPIPARGPRGGPRPPRREAREPDGLPARRRVRLPQGPRLRDGDGAAGRGHHPDPAGGGRRHAGVHGAGVLRPGSVDRRARRHLLAGLRRLVVADRSAGLRGAVRGGHHLRPCPAPTAGPRRPRPERPGRAARGGPRVPREAPGEPAADPGRPAPAPRGDPFRAALGQPSGRGVVGDPPGGHPGGALLRQPAARFPSVR